MSLLTEMISSLLLFFLVYGMSATVELSHVLHQIRNYQAILLGCCMQFIILPFLGFIAIKVFDLPAAAGITLLVITSSPGGSYSNWWCSMFNAELALSVTMTAISTLASTIFLPLNLWMYTRATYSAAVVQSLDWYALFISICTVLGGITCGLITSAYAKYTNQSLLYHKRAHRLGNVAGLCLIMLSIIVSSTASSSSSSSSSSNNNNNNNNNSNNNEQQQSTTTKTNDAVWDQPWTFYAGCSFPAVLGILIVSYLTSKVVVLEHKPERVAVGVESCYQNLGIATSVALTMFSNTASSSDNNDNNNDINNYNNTETGTTDGNMNINNNNNNNEDLALAMGVPLFYGIVEACVLFVFCIVCWKASWTKAPADENLCVILATSYEVDELEHKLQLQFEQQNECTSIEVVLGDTSSSGGGGGGDHHRGNKKKTSGGGTNNHNTNNTAITGCQDLIFTQHTESGDYVVDAVTLHDIVERRKRLDSETSATLSEENELGVENGERNNNNYDGGRNSHNKRTLLLGKITKSRLAAMWKQYYASGTNNNDDNDNNYNNSQHSAEIEITNIISNHDEEQESSSPSSAARGVGSQAVHVENNNNNPSTTASNDDTHDKTEQSASSSRRAERLHRTVLRVRARVAGYHDPDRRDGISRTDLQITTSGDETTTTTNSPNRFNYDDNSSSSNNNNNNVIIIEPPKHKQPDSPVTRRKRVVVNDHDDDDDDVLVNAQHTRGNIIRKYQTVGTTTTECIPPSRGSSASSSSASSSSASTPYHNPNENTINYERFTSSSNHNNNNHNNMTDDHSSDTEDDDHHHIL